ncbi:hypothetical protein Patl1_35606 [Pistacia atlantica]|nr:hypothetical protein Patl1_35606 [Pistacia atlantica]
MSSGFSTLWREQGPSSLWRGSSGKFCGYGVQGGCKFGLYEYFKRLYSDVLVDYNRTSIFFLPSALAQIFADVALCPFESVTVRVQTQPHFAKGLSDGFPKVYTTEGLAGFYRGLFSTLGSESYNALVPMSAVCRTYVLNYQSCHQLSATGWQSNISMTMFSSFEHSVDLINKKIFKKRKEGCSRVQQLGVTCFAAYAAGAVGTLVSNPADNIGSSLYNKKAENVIQAVKKIGLFNLFTRSLPVRITIVGPVITMQWLFYDIIKVLAGL